MIDVYPQLRDTKVEYVWGGTLDFAFDILPHAGQLDGMYFSLGYAGHGVAMSTYLGTKMAELILDGRDQNPFSGLSFPELRWAFTAASRGSCRLRAFGTNSSTGSASRRNQRDALG